MVELNLEAYGTIATPEPREDVAQESDALNLEAYGPIATTAPSMGVQQLNATEQGGMGINIKPGTLAARNYNPGNLRFAGQAGAIEGEGGFAKFKSPQAGFDALKRQIQLDADRGHTLETFMNKYAPATENDTRGYIEFLEKQVGTSKDKKLNEIDQENLARAIAKFESETTFAEPQAEVLSSEGESFTDVLGQAAGESLRKQGQGIKETIAGVVAGAASFVPANLLAFSATVMQTVLENLGVLPKMTPEQKKAMREHLVGNTATLGGILTPKTKTGETGMRAVETAIKPIIATVELGLDTLGVDEAFKAEYPNVADALQFGGEVAAFGMVTNVGKQAARIVKKAREGKPVKADFKNLAKKMEKKIEATPEVRDLIAERRIKNQQAIAGAEGFSAIDIPKPRGLEGAAEFQADVVRRAQTARPRVFDVPEGIEAPTRPAFERMTPEQRQATERFQRQFLPDRRTKSLPLETAAQRAERLRTPDIDFQRVQTMPRTVPRQEPTSSTRVELITEEGLPQREYQINPETGKLDEIYRATERRAYQVDPNTGKVIQTEHVPAKKTVWQTIIEPLKNEDGFIEISFKRKKFQDTVPESVKENTRRLADMAVKANKPFGEFLKEQGFDKREIRTLEKLERMTRVERPMATRTTQEMQDGRDPLVFPAGEANVNVNGKPQVPIAESIFKSVADAKRTVTGSVIRSVSPTLFAMTKFKTPLTTDLWHKANAIEAARIKDLDVLKESVSDLNKRYPNRKLREEAFVKIMSADQQGRAAIEQLGYKPIDGAIKYEGLVKELETHFSDLLGQINEVRKQIGKKPISPRASYLPMIAHEHLLGKVREMFEGKKGSIRKPNLALDSVQEIAQRHDPSAVNATNFRYLRRGKLRQGTLLETDPLKLLSQYGSEAGRHVHYSPLNAFIAELTNNRFADPATGKNTWKMKNVNPELHEFLTRWSNKLAGQPNIVLPQAMRFMERGVQKMSNNLTAATLGWSLRTIMVQPTALLPTATEFGTANTTRGLLDTIRRSKTAPVEQSNVLKNRVADAFINDFVSSELGGPIAKAVKAPARHALDAMQFVDYVMAEATWRTAYKNAKNKLGYGENSAIRFADEAVVRTQGSGFVGDLSPIQMNAIGKAITLWQTFTINHMNWIAKEVLDIKRPERTPVETGRRVMTYLVGTALINTLFEDGMGIQSPQPAPLKAIQKSLEDGNSEGAAALAGLLEMTELLPVGSSIKFGSDPAGAVAQFLNDASDGIKKDLPAALNGDKAAMQRLAFLIAKGAGVPGTQQVKRYVEGKQRGETTAGAVLGRYTAPGGSHRTGRRRAPRRRRRR